jgi:PPOX class probable F420-dependent enzyme
MTILAPDVTEFLKGAHLASLATLRPDGRPHVTPVWYEWDGYEFIVGTFQNAQKLRNVARKGFAALSVYTSHLPYQQVSIEGTARVGSQVDGVWRQRVAVRYLGEAAGKAYVKDTADMEFIAIHVRPIKWTTEGFESS